MQTRVNSVFSLVESRISPKFIFLKLLARIVLGHTRSEANAAGWNRLNIEIFLNGQRIKWFKSETKTKGTRLATLRYKTEWLTYLNFIIEFLLPK